MSTRQDSRADIAFSSRVGVWWNSEAWSIVEASGVARDTEQMGYGSLFFGEGFGKEALMQAGAFLAATDRLVIGTGIEMIELAGTAAEGAHPVVDGGSAVA